MNVPMGGLEHAERDRSGIRGPDSARRCGAGGTAGVKPQKPPFQRRALTSGPMLACASTGTGNFTAEHPCREAPPAGPNSFASLHGEPCAPVWPRAVSWAFGGRFMPTGEGQRRPPPAHAGRLRRWERYTFALVFALIAAILVVLSIYGGDTGTTGPPGSPLPRSSAARVQQRAPRSKRPLAARRPPNGSEAAREPVSSPGPRRSS
jgi:hypothetical protein